MKKFFSIFFAMSVALCSMAVDIYFSYPSAEGTTYVVTANVYAGCFTELDTIWITPHSNISKEWKFAKNKEIPSMTIGTDSYPGQLDEVKGRLFWPINLKAEECGLTEEMNRSTKTLKITLADIYIENKATSEVKKIKEVYPENEKYPLSNSAYICKYLYLNEKGTNADRSYSLSFPSKSMEPNVPYPYLAGEYGVALEYSNSNRYLDQYTNWSNYSGTAYPISVKVLKEDGTLVATYPMKNHGDCSFSFIVNDPITEPGNYYFIYDVKGRAKGWDATKNEATPGCFINAIKVGPYIVDNTITTRTIGSTLSDTSFSETIYVDKLPTEWQFTISNAALVYLKEAAQPSLRCTKSGMETITVNPEVTCNGNVVTVSLDKLNAQLTKSGTPAAGSYTLYLDKPDEVLGAYNSNHNVINFANRSSISRALKLTAATPAATLGAYIEKSGSTVQLEKGESVKVKLGTASANDSKIFVKWTKAGAQTKAAATDAPSGFTQHSGAVTISEAGTLEYYTQISNTISDVKSITFTVREPVAVAADVKQVAFGSNLYTDALPTEWSFSIENTATLAKTATNPTVTCTLPDKSTVSATCPLSVNGRMVTVNLAELNKKFTDPAKGNYTLAIATPETYLTATPISGDNIQWSAISASYSLSTPAPTGELSVFVKSKENAIELSQGETIEVKLATDNAGDHAVYYKWTPAEEASVARPTNAPAVSAPAGFLEHTGTISVNGAGTLEYYTRHSNTISDVKSINFTVKDDTPTGVGEIEAEAAEGEALYYNLDGVRVHDPSAPGIYIVKSANGKSRKVLVK